MHGDGCHHRDHYQSRYDAEQAAEQLGISGAHEMTCMGETMYMPGSSHQEYKDAISGPMPPTNPGIPGMGHQHNPFGL